MASSDAQMRQIRRPGASRAALQDAPLPNRGIRTTGGRYMIHLFPDHTLQKHFEEIGRTYELEGLFHDDIKIYSAHLDDQLLDSIRRDPGVQGVVRPSWEVDEEPDWVKVETISSSDEEPQSGRRDDRTPKSDKAALESSLADSASAKTATGDYFIRFFPEHGPDDHFDAIGRSREYDLECIYDDESTVCYAAKGLSKKFLELVWSDPGVESVVVSGPGGEWEEGEEDDEDEWALSRINHSAVATARAKTAERHQQSPGGAAAAYKAALEDPSDPSRGAYIVPARYLVFLRSGHSPEMHFSAIGYRYRLSRVYHYKGTSVYFAAMEADLLDLVRSDPGVEAVVFNTAGKEDTSAMSKVGKTAQVGGTVIAETETGSTQDYEPSTDPALKLAPLADPSQPEKGVGIVPGRYMFSFFQGYNPIDHFRALGRTYEIRTLADCTEFNIWGATMSDELRDRMRSDPRVEDICHVASGVWEGKKKTNVSNPA